MKKISQEIGKKIISIDGGIEVGYLLDLAFDESLQKFLGYIIVDKESENEMFISYKDMKIGECCIIDKTTALLPFSEQSYNPFGKSVYSSDGIFLGIVEDLELKGQKIAKIITNYCEISSKYISAAGDCLIFSKARHSKSIFKINRPKVEIMATPRPQPLTKIAMFPSMILDRVATNDVYGFNNEIIVRKGEKITQKIVEKAKKHNKINNLIFNSQ